MSAGSVFRDLWPFQNIFSYFYHIVRTVVLKYDELNHETIVTDQRPPTVWNKPVQNLKAWKILAASQSGFSGLLALTVTQ